MNVFTIETAEGIFTAHFSERGLSRLDFPPAKPARNRAGKGQEKQSPELCQWLGATAAALKQVLAGKTPEALPPLDISTGTDFQRRVWSALQVIAVGRAKTYGQIAAAIGRPKTARAVGGACGANPIPLLIPCHRVLAANNRIGGFSRGLEWKRKLLAREGILTADA